MKTLSEIPLLELASDMINLGKSLRKARWHVMVWPNMVELNIHPEPIGEYHTRDIKTLMDYAQDHDFTIDEKNRFLLYRFGGDHLEINIYRSEYEDPDREGE